MTEDDGKVSYFIGAGNGLNETIDVNLIVSFGSPFPNDAGDALFGRRVSGVEKRSAGTKRVSAVAGKRPAKKSTTTRSPSVKGKKK
jgi:hypothetical protein